MLRGSFSNYTYNSSKNDGYNYGRLLQRDLDSGETVLYGYTPNLDDFSLSKIRIDKTIPRVHFIAQYCFNQHDLSSPLNPIAFSDILADVASSYSCITGDNTSTVITQDELNNSNFDVYHAVDSAFETLSNQSITNAIMQNLGGKAKCNSLEKHISENKSPSIMVNNKGLSVYRDFQGNYRSPTSSSGAIDIHCSDD